MARVDELCISNVNAQLNVMRINSLWHFQLVLVNAGVHAAYFEVYFKLKPHILHCHEWRGINFSIFLP